MSRLKADFCIWITDCYTIITDSAKMADNGNMKELSEVKYLPEASILLLKDLNFVSLGSPQKEGY